MVSAQYDKRHESERLMLQLDLQKVQELEVVTAAKDQCDTALLVYANERAMSFIPGDLPPQLGVRLWLLLGQRALTLR